MCELATDLYFYRTFDLPKKVGTVRHQAVLYMTVRYPVLSCLVTLENPMLHSTSQQMPNAAMRTVKPEQNASETLVIGPDLRVISTTGDWQKWGMEELAQRRKMIHDIFPATQIYAFVLDVLTSGQPVHGELIRLTNGEYLCVSLFPLPANVPKPKKVLLTANVLDAQLYVDEETGVVLEANEAASALFGEPVEYLIGQSIWSLQPFAAEETRRSTLEALTRKNSLYLGAFKLHSKVDAEVDLEAAMVLLDE
jgi:PAS domain-containing protein